MCARRAVPGVLLVLLGMAFLVSGEASALVVGGGSEPVGDGGWPTGALAVANLPTRVSYWIGPPFGGGQYCFQYRCKETKGFNEALEAFSRIVAPRLELVVLDGVKDEEAPFEQRTDWEVLLWVPGDFYQFARAALPRAAYHSLPAPTLTVYTGGGSPIRWDEVKVPPNLNVNDKRVETSAYRDSKGGVVEMHVFDMASGKALPGVTISLAQSSPEGQTNKYHIETDDRGAAVLRDIAKGVYAVRLSCSGYAPRSLEPYWNRGRTLEVSHVALSRAGNLSGRVTGADGKPLAGAKVLLTDTFAVDGTPYVVLPFIRCEARGGEAVTDGNGRFLVKDVPTGRVGDLRVHKGGYVRASVSQEIPASDIQIVMHFGAVVQGRVKGPQSRSPDQQVLVGLEAEGSPVGGWGGGQVCEADGRFAFQNVPPGRYVLTATLNPRSEKDKDRWPRTTVDVKATRPGEIIEVNLEIK